MTFNDLVQKIVAEVNKQSKYCSATGDNDVLNISFKLSAYNTSKIPAEAKLQVGETALDSALFVHTTPEKVLLLVGNEGDTYFQRWDSVKTLPRAADDNNQVIDVASVMLESHINLDGRTDIDRGSTKLCSLNWTDFGAVNKVYSQTDNFLSNLDYDTDAKSYPSSITWTSQKNSGAEVDEWTHITLASILAMDGDKGPVTALRRFQNNVVAFQDKGVSEVLFNTRTQLSTTDGVPVEIANSGKVDGKRYISAKHGVTNKWSIAEGKAGLYFVDNINKAFCSFDGQGINNLSEKLGFGSWFRAYNEIKSWTPKEYNNIVTFYDRVNSEVYLVRNEQDTTEAPCLVYNENLNLFSSFYDYGSVPMFVNVQDKYLAFKNNSLWEQNAGLYCNFFGKKYDYWVTYRATPDPYGDKIWTNLEFKTDAYRVLDESGDNVVDEKSLISGNEETYQPYETFCSVSVWNEYQTTGEISFMGEKKFRTWRFAIPRAKKTTTNKYGLDRIRNPWINIKLRKHFTKDNQQQDLMQIHDIEVKYFE